MCLRRSARGPPARLLRLQELHIEQVAFLTAPRCGGEIRLEMMGGEFCGNALRCAGFYHALRTGVQGKTCVFAEISGAEGVQPVMADTAAGEASTVMPLPARGAAGRVAGCARRARDVRRHHALRH